MLGGPSNANARHRGQKTLNRQRAPISRQKNSTRQQRRSPVFPSILQWNVNGLRTRLPGMRESLKTERADVLALQETNVVPGEERLSPYVFYHSAPINPNDRSRVAILVRDDVYHNPIDLWT